MKVSLFGYNRKETDDYCNYLTDSNAKLIEELRSLKAKNEELEKELSEYKSLDEVNKRELDILKDKVGEYETSESDYKRQVEELNEQLSSKPDASETERLGIIFAVAYRDMENKNKAVSAKIREYAEMMFNRMAAYRNEVADIVNSVNEMQTRQKEALTALCNEATAKLDKLTEASASTVEDMKKIEGSRNAVCREIENMISETINTDAGSLPDTNDGRRF